MSSNKAVNWQYLTSCSTRWQPAKTSRIAVSGRVLQPLEHVAVDRLDVIDSEENMQYSPTTPPTSRSPGMVGSGQGNGNVLHGGLRQLVGNPSGALFQFLTRFQIPSFHPLGLVKRQPTLGI